MNKHFTKNHDIITDTSSHTKLGTKPWMGIIPHTNFAVTEITIEGVNGDVKLTSLTTPTAAQYVADIPVGQAFLCQVRQIKLSAGGCKMINPN